MALARRPNDVEQEPFLLAYDHAQVTATTATKLFKVPAGRKVRVDAVDYVNPTGLAADAANFFDVQLKKGATVMANWSTETGQEGVLTADTFVLLSKSATDANLVANAGDEISLNLAETGTATLPAGRIIVRGRYV